MADIIQVTDADFDEQVLGADVPALVDLWAEWCAPCRMMAPVIEELAEEQQGRLRVAKLDVQEHVQTAARYGVTSIPTLLFFVDGELKERLVGFMPKAKIMERIGSYLE